MLDSITESELILPTLMILFWSPDSFCTTAELRKKLSVIVNPQGRDLEDLDSLKSTHFDQKVRNLVSNRDTNNLGKKGLANYISEKNGWEITQKGKELYKKSVRMTQI